MSSVAFIILAVFCHAVVGERDYFRAAILEHRSRGNRTLHTQQEISEMNLKIYDTAADVASKAKTDIIVFPEYAITQTSKDRAIWTKFAEDIPDPRKSTYNPCTDKEVFQDRPVLSGLSCLARKYKLYVVASMGDILPCATETCSSDAVTECDCPKDGHFLYNTAVVFDREGNFIARFHKNHPYFEVVNAPEIPEFTTFETDFGIFGIMICFDSVWKDAVDLVEKYKIDTLLFPTHWYVDIIPLNAIEFQQSWALTNKVNLIAADQHVPGTGTLGSGIYSKYSGALKYTYFPDGKSKLLIADVANKNGVTQQKSSDEDDEVIVITEEGAKVEEEDYEDFPLNCYDELVGPPENNSTDYRCFKPQVARYTLTKLEKTSGDLVSCNNGLCCILKYTAKSMDEDYYLAAFNGTNDVKNYFQWAEETCLLVRCDPYNGKPCVTFPSKAETVFEAVELTGNFTTDYVYPTVSKNYNRLAPKSEWSYQQPVNVYPLKFQSTSDKPLLKVALMGRCYHRDPPFIPYYKYLAQNSLL